MELENLLYSTSKLEKVFFSKEPFYVPDNGFTGMWEATATFDDEVKAIVSYMEGGAHLGDRYTFVVAQSPQGWATYGWAKGWRLPVPERGFIQDFVEEKNMLKALVWAEKGELPLIQNLPGFFTGRNVDGNFLHKDRWFTRSIYALPRPVPDFIKEAQVWSIREGIYISFPDGSYRLIPHRQWWEFMEVIRDYDLELIGRQGDLLVFSYEHPPIRDEEVDFRPLEKESIDRHEIIIDGKAECQKLYRIESFIFRSLGQEFTLTFTHPEHERMDVKVASNGCWVVLLPGTSHPFEKKID